jgi:hypothetical protein
MNLETITETEAFYGYITGLGIEQNYDPENSERPKFYATFEYAGETKIWIVPDSKLFGILANHLHSMAALREGIVGAYGMNKLWIQKIGTLWSVDLP